jgi:hypothetical protein
MAADVCPRCGHALRDDDGESWLYCENCGWPDDEEAPEMARCTLAALRVTSNMLLHRCTLATARCIPPTFPTSTVYFTIATSLGSPCRSTSNDTESFQKELPQWST